MGFEEVVAGGVAGGVAGVLTSPLELLKTRLQSDKSLIHQKMYRTNLLKFTLQSMKDIVRTEGVKSLWKGATPTILGSIPSRAIFFGVYSTSQELFRDFPETTNCLVSSFLGGMVATTLTSPIWMVKTRMQLNEQKGTISPFVVCRDILRQEGVKYFWKGIGASWLGVLETCTQWLILERIKRDPRADPRHVFWYAAAAKLIATTMWYPHEVMRTRMREKNNTYRNMAHCCAQILRSESCAALYSGLGIQLLRVVPNFALTVSLYQAGLSMLQQ